MTLDPRLLKIAVVVFGVVLLAGCITNTTVTKPAVSIIPSTTIGPYPQPHGRIMLLGSHRAQLLFSCRQTPLGGTCRFTHGASGRVIELRWQSQHIWQRSNDANHQQWQAINIEALYKLGLVVHPATMMQLLNGTIPSWLHPKATNKWQGKHNNARIQMQWYPDQHRLDMTNLSKGAKIRLLLDR